MTFKVGDKAKCGVSEVTILGVASNGMYACEYDNGAVGFLNPSDLDENTPGEWNAALDAACSRLGRWPTPGSVNQSVKDECIGLIRALKRSAP